MVFLNTLKLSSVCIFDENFISLLTTDIGCKYEKSDNSRINRLNIYEIYLITS